MNGKMLMIAFAGNLLFLALILISLLSLLVPVIIVPNMIHKSRCVLMIICLNITLNMIQSCLYLNIYYFYRLENKSFSCASYGYYRVSFGKVLFTSRYTVVFKYDIIMVLNIDVLSFTTICYNATGINVILTRVLFRATLLIMPMLFNEISRHVNYYILISIINISVSNSACTSRQSVTLHIFLLKYR